MNVFKQIIILFFLFNNTFSQSIKDSILVVEYDIFYNTEIPNTKKGILEINLNSNEAIFYLSKSNLTTGITKEDNKITLIGKNSTRYMKINNYKKKIQYIEFIANETYLVNDTITKLDWNINYDEIKKIGDFHCNKATLYFRGRNYIAWYDINNPITFGPWKFNNLPGLILEIYDDTNRYNWKVNSIKYTNKSNIVLEEEIITKELSFKEYINLKYGQINSTISSQMPRGVETQIINVGRTGIEIKFEWEK